MGYRREQHFVKLPGGHEDDQRVRSCQEAVNTRFKQWGWLNKVFGHEVTKHQFVFNTVSVITQLAIENGEPLFGVPEYRGN